MTASETLNKAESPLAFTPYTVSDMHAWQILNIQANVRADIRPRLQPDIRPHLRPDICLHIRPDMHPDITRRVA